MTPRSTSRLVTNLIRALGLKPAKRRRAPTRLPSDASQSAQLRLAAAAKALSQLSDDQRDQWRAYAKTQTVFDPKTGAMRTRQYDKVFVGLAYRFLHCTPYGAVPLTPPAFPFAGDAITVTIEGGVRQITVQASGATSPNVRVEIATQYLLSPSRSPQTAHYRTQAFVQMGSGPVILPHDGGWFAPAYRFVHVETGQDTPFVPLPKVRVWGNDTPPGTL